ncbi:hypothetical protein MCOR25_007843 [Pyricularia grisea]|uniref:RNase III domain-containing protein n=1 Tax=Pyricularia grisea TaxID=148305 RepID=A0A6P8ASK2_PYRGI|nr:uncharacterized protein PgNI_09701 [Pyricularia grisea]KAI6356802.1 hypothetical protein MCOR25_007843 [Pyricularia grisea]TLD05100.1 hypothetical protein PgNI_09701 [Pyricularia grisea]
MVKRSHCEPDGGSLKRAKVEGDNQIKDLLQCWEDLNASMGTLKDSAQTLSSPTLAADTAFCDRLVSLSERLLKSTQALASQSRGGDHAKTTTSSDDTIAVSSHVSYTKWTSADIQNDLPPLPEIKDASIENAAFTHSSVVCNKSSGIQSYDRLEWLGDAYLELFSTCFIYQTFPVMSHGASSQLREMLIRNDSLAQWTQAYGLEKKARLPPEFLGLNHSGQAMMEKTRTKIYGDLFEAYVGAIIASDPVHGTDRAATWLKSLWAPKLKREIKAEEKRQRCLVASTASLGTNSTQGPTENCAAVAPNPNRTPKEALAAMLVVKGIKLTYVDLPPPKKKDKNNNLPLFAVAVVLDGWGESGLQLGVGTAKSKSEAGQAAAQRALQNKKLITKYSELKRASLSTST